MDTSWDKHLEKDSYSEGNYKEGHHIAWRNVAGLSSIKTMKALQVRLGTVIRRLREKAGFSQEGFAGQAGIARAYMGQIERGRVNLTLNTVERIAEALDMKVGELMTEVDREK